MTARRPGIRFAIVLSLLAIAAEQASAAQPARAAPGRFARHPYTSALGAVWNYRSCGVYVRAARYQALDAALQASDAAARAKGLGPALDQLRADYEALLAVSTMMACAHGPVVALRDARRAVAAFQAWVAAQPPAAAH